MLGQSAFRRMAVLSLLVSLAWCGAGSALPAFPGAEGAGGEALGGRGGKIVFVTNLNDSGPGSLRDACGMEGARTILFRVAGLIDLKSPIEVRHGRVTIAGQTAPGDGVCLRGAGLSIHADDVVVRYLRIRPGDILGDEVDGLCVSDSRRVVIDHCSVSWSVDEVLSVVGKSDEITVQWCIITEALHNSVHKKGPHGMGSLLRSENGAYSFHHCLYAHNNTRNPRPGDNYDKSPGVLLDFRNNVIYNWGGACGYGMKERYRMNYIGNFLKPGPSTKLSDRWLAFHVGGPGNSLFFAENVFFGYPEANADNWRFVGWSRDMAEADREPVRMTTAHAVAAVSTQPARSAYRKVLANVGATHPTRDTVDTRVTREVRMGSGRIIDSQKDVGGWPTYHAATPPSDRDSDGMPDTWEEKNGMNPDDPSDATTVASDGYTNLEHYLNTL